ncbi:MAG TPA: glycosyltransferase family 9 protein [Elusimicrobiota bacterium]|nr:glycosyltransferase family 9 protein [Elusimicrobiota bacterium]
MNVLVIRLSSLGDVLLTTPVLPEVRRKWPGCRVTVLVKKAYVSVFEGNPDVDEVAVFEDRGLWGWFREIRRRSFHQVIDLHGTFRSFVWTSFGGRADVARYDKDIGARRKLVWSKRSSPALAKNVVQRYLETVGVSVDVPPTPRLYPSPSDRLPSWMDRCLGKGPVVGVAPGARHATKCWIPERFAEAADRLAARLGGPVVLFGSPSDVPAAEQVMRTLAAPCVSLAGKTTLRELLILIRRCSIFLTNDSGPMHVASAWGVPTVAVFGPTVREFGFFPSGRSVVVQNGEGPDRLYCRPCHLHGSPSCPERHFRCMSEIDVDQVLAAADTVLKAEGVR